MSLGDGDQPPVFPPGKSGSHLNIRHFGTLGSPAGRWSGGRRSAEGLRYGIGITSQHSTFRDFWIAVGAVVPWAPKPEGASLRGWGGGPNFGRVRAPRSGGVSDRRHTGAAPAFGLQGAGRMVGLGVTSQHSTFWDFRIGGGAMVPWASKPGGASLPSGGGVRVGQCGVPGRSRRHRAASRRPCAGRESRFPLS